jgi:hypothetical protein
VQLILWPSLLSDTACDKLVSLLATAEKRHSGWCVISMIRDEINMENITHKKAAMLAA